MVWLLGEGIGLKREDRLLYLFVFTGAWLWFFHFVTDYIVTGSSAVATAAFATGAILNPPSYPLFGIFSSVFGFLPFGTNALKANLLASFCGGVSAVLVAAVSAEIFKSLKIQLDPRLKRLAMVLSAALWAVTPIAIAHFAHIEKYSVSILFFQLLVLVGLKVLRQDGLSGPAVFVLAVTTGLTILAHYLFTPAVLMTWMLVLIRHRASMTRYLIFPLVAGLVVGLLPVLYLPLRSLRDPILDWWDPETFHNLWQTLTRRQYQGFQLPLTWDYFFSREKWYYDLVLRQWFISPLWLFLPLSVVLIWQKWISRIKGFLILLMLPLCAETVSAFLRIYDPAHSIPSLTAGFDRYHWSFYMHWLIVFSSIFSVFLGVLAARLRSPALRYGLYGGIGLMLLIPSAYERFQAGREPAVLREWITNLNEVLQPGDLVLVSFDALYFATLEAQVEGRMSRDVHVLHTSLLVMPWYTSTLERLYGPWYQPFREQGLRLKEISTRFYDDPADMTQAMKMQELSANLVMEMAKSANQVLLVSNVNMMPMSQIVESRFQVQPSLIGSWAIRSGIEMKEIPWPKWSFKETFTGSVDEFPWLLAFRNGLRSQWKKIRGIEAATYPEQHPFHASFEKLLSRDDHQNGEPPLN